MPTYTADDHIRTSGLAAHEAKMLLVAASGLLREQLITHDGSFDAGVIETYRKLCSRRAAGEPIAYLTGQREFYGRIFQVSPDVLIPRPETEHLVEQALLHIPGDGTGLSLLDLGTGSGIIAASLACERPQLSVTATDISPMALNVARANAARLGAQVRLLESNWFSALQGQRYQLIVSNPPYIAAHDTHLTQGDLRYEPRGALTDGVDGIAALRQIIAASPFHLEPGGWLLLEHGHDQTDPVHDLLTRAGFAEVQSWPDLAGIARVSGGCLPPSPANHTSSQS